MLLYYMDQTDHLLRTIALDVGLRVATVVTTGAVIEAQRRHSLSPAATVAVGRSLTAGLLLATLTKGEERVTLQILGDGGIGSITVDAFGDGSVRGYALHPQAGPSMGRGRPTVAATVGRHGVVNVLRDLGLKDLYQGQVALVTGEVDEDVEAYLRTSEQVPSALGCEVVLASDGSVIAAGGVLVQALPGGQTDAIREAQHALRTGALYDLLSEPEHSPRVIAERMYPYGPLEPVGPNRLVQFHCQCSAEKIAETLALLGTVDLDEMIAENKPAEVVCNFCNAHYQIGRAELERIRTEVAGGPRESN
jgi:molecular chaperone Hsp33